MLIVDKPEACTRCLICEMACSFHHIGEFSRSHSSIRVGTSVFEQDGVPQITIGHGESEPGPKCDFCEGEDSPLCVRFCPETVLKKETSRA